MARPRLAQLRGARAAVADRGQACLRCGTAQPTALLSSRTQSMNIAVSMVILGREAGFIPALISFTHCFSIPSANPRPSHRQSRENSALLIVSVFPSADPRPSHPQISEISAFLIVSVFPSADPRPLHQQSREFSAFLIVSASPPPSPRPSHPQINEISLFPQCFSLPSIP